jgi:putative peptide zinc metalloprotease protein
MTAVTPSPGTLAPAGAPGDGHGGAPSVPVRAEGVELLGQMKGSGYRTPPALVRRSDGQTIHLTRLLYLVLEAIDGRRDHAAIAAEVSERFGKQASADDIATLVETKLRPLGVLAGADGSQPDAKKANPLLALKFKYVVSDPARTRRVTAPFAWLFAPVLAVLALVAFLAASWWVLFEKGLASAAHEAFQKPGLILLVFVLTVVSAGFHEFGHAAACRYGGAAPNAMGVGLYLVWPAFYTEVTDSYRLGRAGRLRVDLGGLYFNALFALATLGAWALTGYDALLLVIATQILQMLRQLAPFVRFDGYHVLADLTGVPDLYHHIGPTLLGLLPNRWGRPEGKVLKPWARAVVTIWVLVVVPVLLLSMVMMILVLPRVVATAWHNLGLQWAALQQNLGGGDFAGVGVRILSVLAILVPLLGTVYLLARLVRQVSTRVMRSTEGQPRRRAGAAAIAALLILALAWAWMPRGQYHPIQANEGGTLTQGLALAGLAPKQSSGLRNGDIGATQTVVASADSLGSKEDPTLALVVMPKGDSTGDASWVFPFNRPAAPGPGDNQAMAVNTKDGSTVYDVAFALVWADTGSATQKNEAYALASCKACKTVAVGFQVILVVGQADLVMPQDIAAAVNYTCVECVTYALAKQLILTLPGAMSADGKAALDAVWAQVQAFGANIKDVPLAQIRTQLEKFAAAITAIVEKESGTASSTQTQVGSGSTAGSDPSATPMSGSDGGTAPAPDAGSTPPPAASDAPTPQPSDTSTTTATDSPTGTTSP